MKSVIHPITAIIATLCIFTFFCATVLTEACGSPEAIATVKARIVFPGLYILLPAIAASGASGFALAKGRTGKSVKQKMKRMPFIAINGLFILLPAAIYLNSWAAAGIFDTKFYVVQGIELFAGFVNLVLMGINMRDGLRMTGKLRSSQHA